MNRVLVLDGVGRLNEARALAEELRVNATGVPFPFPGEAWVVIVARCMGVDRWFELLESQSGWRTPWHKALVELVLGNPDRAVELYAALEAPMDIAFARIEAARAHLAAGRRRDAEAHLEAALEFFRFAGATRYVAEAEALLAPAAAEARRSP